METKTSAFSYTEDRISNLPDALIHHILSFTHMKYAVQTSVLSRRWRYLWMSLRTLRLHDYLFAGDEEEGLTRHIDFVDRVLLLRDQSDIQSFHLVWRDEYATSSRLNTWILIALKRNIQELYVHATIYKEFPLPPSLFTCNSLTKLELELGTRNESKIILPHLVSLPQLKSLKLASLSFGDENLTSKLFSGCPVLESLTIIDSNMGFNFSSLKLKHFKMYNYDYGCPFDDLVKTIKLLSAPNLTSFSCKEYMSQDYYLENLSSLVTADIDMIVENDESDETPETYSKLSIEVKGLYAQRMMKFLRAVHNVEDLKLSPGFLEVVSGASDLLESRPPQFCNLRCLKLHTWVSANCMNAITYLLKIFPNVESLSLGIHKLHTTDIGDDWEARLSIPCRLYHHLKFVKIHGFEGCLNELKFLEILLKNAMVLEKVVLFRFEPDSPARRWNLNRSY